MTVIMVQYRTEPGPDHDNGELFSISGLGFRERREIDRLKKVFSSSWSLSRGKDPDTATNDFVFKVFQSFFVLMSSIYFLLE